MITQLKEKVLNGGQITREEAILLAVGSILARL